MKLININVYPGGQAIVNAALVAWIEERRAGVRIHFVGGGYIDAPGQLDSVADQLRAEPASPLAKRRGKPVPV